MAFQLPVVDAASLASWCERHLGSPVESELFRTGHLTRVIGTRLADGRGVVVRVRPAPRPGDVSSLVPAPPWAAWNHDQGGLWPWPEDLDVDLNQVDGPGWVDAAAQAARRKLREGQDQAVIGHGDWITDNLRWDGSRLLVAYDWDSLIADSEAVIAGLAAAIYLYPALPTVSETSEFLAAYAAARGRPFGPGELQRCWAAGLWTRAYDAKHDHVAGKPVTSLTRDEACERLRRAGMR